MRVAGSRSTVYTGACCRQGDAAMYAPPIKARQAKTASQTTPTRALKPRQRTPLWSGAGLSNHAVLRSPTFAAQQAKRLAESTSANHRMQEADPERIAS